MLAHRIKSFQQRIRRLREGHARQTGKDLALARRLYNTFERDLELAEIQGIHLYVQNGVVTLYGTVRHELDRELLISLVREMPGVKGVVAHLQLVDARFQDTLNAEPE